MRVVAALWLAAPALAQHRVRVPAAAFTMGSDDGPADERPAHTVTLAEFEIGWLAVTNALYPANPGSLNMNRQN